MVKLYTDDVGLQFSLQLIEFSSQLALLETKLKDKIPKGKLSDYFQKMLKEFIGLIDELLAHNDVDYWKKRWLVLNLKGCCLF